MSDSFELVGRCPVCGGPEAADGVSSAYSASTIDSSDKLVPLVWSVFYNQNVCRLCKIEGEDKMVDDVRIGADNEREQERQQMGYRRTYETN